MTKMNAALAAALVTTAAVLTVSAPANAAVSSDSSANFASACRTGKVPNVTGLSEDAAKQRLSRYHFRNVRVSVQKSGFPLTVVTQLPAAGSVYKTCSEVRIILGE